MSTREQKLLRGWQQLERDRLLWKRWKEEVQEEIEEREARSTSWEEGLTVLQEVREREQEQRRKLEEEVKLAMDQVKEGGKKRQQLQK